MTHSIAWHTAQPLWPLSLNDTGNSPPRFREPALLRFAGDDYMQQLQSTLTRDPQSLAQFVARPESWDTEIVGWRNQSDPADADPLKLFQPAHYRFYLIAAALVCQMPGLPERAVNAAQRERCSFVMRRLFPKAGAALNPLDESTYDEFGWIGTPQHGVWRPLIDSEVPLADEERLALFPKTFDFESGKRTLQSGLIPVARRDIYQAGVADISAPAPAALLQADTFSSEAAAQAFQKIDKALDELSSSHDASGDNEDALKSEKKISFAYTLLDLADFMRDELSAVSQALPTGSTSGLSSSESTVMSRMNQFASGTSLRWREILIAVSQSSTRQSLESGQITASNVDALFGGSLNRSQLGSMADQLRGGGALRDALIAAIDPRSDTFNKDVMASWNDVSKPALTEQAAQDAFLGVLLHLSEFLTNELPAVWTALANGASASLSTADHAVFNSITQQIVGSRTLDEYLLDADAHRKEILASHITPQVLVIAQRLSNSQIAATLAFAATLATLVRAALAAKPLPSKSQAQSQLASAPPTEPNAPAWYRIRCVYERPLCAPAHDPIVSEPSAPFQLAGFFDPAAPIRPIRIQMPEASLDQLRRGAKGVSIATSKELRSQIDRARNAGLKGLTDQSVGGGSSFDFGLICQLSIPIITICAFILLMIIVQLLNIIFHWIPYFILCLPRIGKKG